MSVIRMLTRLTAVAALRGKTWADDRVFDSDNTPLSLVLTAGGAAKPYIVVYTDADNRHDFGGTELYAARREMNLVLEIGVASKVEGTTGDAQIKTPLTDEGMEMALDMVEAQALDALFGDPQSDWAELFKSFVIRVERIVGQRGASADRDRRWAARQLGIICDVLSDIAYGCPVPEFHPIRTFIETSENNPESDMAPAATICAALVNQKTAPQWEQVQATLGVRRLGLRAIGLAPLASNIWPMAVPDGDDLTDTRGEAPILRKITADDEQMEHDPEHGLIDDTVVETNVIVVKIKEPKDKVTSDGEVE
jgi:hypothetical protein